MNNIVVLVYPYFKTEDNLNQKLFLPLGIASLSAQIKLKKEKVAIIDCTFKKFHEVIDEIVQINPKIIGFYSMISLSKNTYELVQALKPRLNGALYICGGPLASLYPELFKDHFDIVFRGEMDNILAEFVQNFLKFSGDKDEFIRKSNLQQYKGIYINKKGFFLETNGQHLSEKEFQALPIPDREDFDHWAYQNYWEEREGYKATSIITTVGCPFNCDFCSRPIFGSQVRKRKIDVIIREIELIKALGYNYLWIADDCFSLDLRFLEKFCDAMIDKNLNMKWSCLSRSDTLELRIARMMKLAGCDKVYLGLESGNNEVLKLMNKKLTVENGRTVVNILKQVGIKIGGFFLVGYPGETWDTIEDTFNYALELELDEISFNVPYPLPGTPLFERVCKIDMTKDWTIENEIAFVYKSEFDEIELKKRIEECYQKYALIKASKIGEKTSKSLPEYV